jgi:zinc protease
MKRIALILAFAMSAALTSTAQDKPKTDAQRKPEAPKSEAQKTDAKAPNKSSTKIDVPNLGAVNRVFNGAASWHSDPASGLRELSGVELAQMKRASDFYVDLNYNKHYAKMEVKGKEKVGSYETYVIEAAPAEGSPEKLYFDVNTGLLVRHDMETESPEGKAPSENYMDDYKVVDGVKIPHVIKYVNPMISWVIKFTEVKNNIEIDNAKFNKPSN